MVNLPTEAVPVTQVNPIVSLFYGATKIGKTAVLAELPDNLIIDLEKGALTYECMRVTANTYNDFIAIAKELEVLRNSEEVFPYNYITIDTIDRLVEWVEVDIVKQWNEAQNKTKDPVLVRVYSEIPYGKGYDLVRLEIRRWVNFFRKVSTHLIITGHLKRTIIGDTKVEVKEDNLDLVGKLRNLICADADAIGYMFRDTEGEERIPALKVSFQASEATAAGSRHSHLRGKIITISTLVNENEYKTDWSKIYLP